MCIVYDAYVREIPFVGWVEDSGHYPSLEWAQPFPPAHHTYNELPFVYAGIVQYGCTK